MCVRAAHFSETTQILYKLEFKKLSFQKVFKFFSKMEKNILVKKIYFFPNEHPYDPISVQLNKFWRCLKRIFSGVFWLV